MGPALWESRREGATNTAHPETRSYANFSGDIYEWQLGGPFESRLRLPAVPMPSLAEPNRPRIPAVKKRRNGRQTYRKERHILDWLSRDNLSPKPVPKHAFRSPDNKLKPLERGSISSPEFKRIPQTENKSTARSGTQLPRISFETVLSHRHPQTRYTKPEYIHRKEINFTPPGHRRSQNQYYNSHLLRYPQWSLEAVNHKQRNFSKEQTLRSYLDPLPDTPAPRLVPPPPPPPPPQSLNTLPQSKAPTTDENTPTGVDETAITSVPQRNGWDPRRHYLQAHFRGLDIWRDEDPSNLPCDLRDPNDSFAYNDVIEYMLDNDLMSMTKLRQISKWIDETLPPGFIYDEQRAWFVAIDPAERRSISSLSSVSHNT